MEKNEINIFETLSKIDCSEHLEVKKQGQGLTYLSWAWAWHICKQHFPLANYTIYENAEGRPYFDDGRTAWVKTGVTINGLEHIEYLPILDQAAHASLTLDRITSWDMNKAIQRSLTKALARHGLGLYVYAGEDLPWTGAEENKQARAQEEVERAAKRKPAPAPAPAPAAPAPAPAEKKPVGIKERWIKALAEKSVNAQGVDAETAYKEKFHPTPEEWALIQDEVYHYKKEHNIQ